MRWRSLSRISGSKSSYRRHEARKRPRNLGVSWVAMRSVRSFSENSWFPSKRIEATPTRPSGTDLHPQAPARKRSGSQKNFIGPNDVYDARANPDQRTLGREGGPRAGGGARPSK